MNKIYFVALFVLVLIYPTFVSASSAAIITSPYLYNFNDSGVVQESSDTSISSSPYWWVNSGAYLKIDSGRGSTNKDSLPAIDSWRVLYSRNNPTDTDNGFHPQNIFRLLTRSKWGNARQEAYFVINKDNLSASSNRNISNGLLLMSRYQDGSTLYYAGVRVDGSAIIKKKKNGTYYTLAEIKNIYPGTYNKASSPNLLPKNKWIGLRTEVVNLADGKVEIKLFIDKGWQGQWSLVASAIDNGTSYGGSAITQDGFGGIRTDFMDVEFENFRIKNI